MPVLAYHKIDDRFEWGFTRTTTKQFESQLRLIHSLGYKICSLGEFIRNPSQDRVALTFDDAFESVYTNVYPLLEGLNASFTVFPVAKYIGKFNTWEINLGGIRFKHLSGKQLLEMRGCEIGSHTITHRSLPSLSPAEMRTEICDSKKIIEDAVGRRVDYLSLPFGRFDERVIGIAQDAGYKNICSLNPDNKAEYVVGRYAVYLVDFSFAFRNKLNSGILNRMEINKLKLINFFSRGMSLGQKLFKNHLFK